MDNVKLTHLLAVIETGNFARAAASLGISQPAISKSIKALEADVGVPLLSRGRFGAEPTEYGRLLSSHARIILAEANLARAELRALGNADARRLAVGASLSLSQTLLPEAIARFRRRWPDVVMAVDVGLSAPLFEGLLGGELDFVISAPPTEQVIDDALVQSYLLDEQDVLLVGAHHPLVGRDVQLADLLDYPWIVPRRSGRLRHIQSVFAASHLPPPARMIRSESADLARALLVREPFICLIGKNILDVHIDAGLLAVLPDLGLSTTRPAFLTRRRRSWSRPAARNFAALVQEVAGERRQA